MSHQRETVEVNNNYHHVEFHGERLMNEELVELGLEPDCNHVRVEFDNERTASYSLLASCIGISAATYCLAAPIYCFCYPCIYSGFKKSAESRKAIVTEKQLVLKGGYYACCCCCWNEQTKSVPLDKITDLSIKQGCIQRCCNIKEVSVDTASSSSQAPDLKLIGIKNPEETRAMVLKVRDETKQFGSEVPHQTSSNIQLLATSNSQLSQNLDTSFNKFHHEQQVQTQTLVEIKSLLGSVKDQLVILNEKQDGKQRLLS